MKKYIALLIALLIMFPLLWAYAADVPFIMNYQGSVKTSGGTPYNGNGYFKFAFVNSTSIVDPPTYWSNDDTSTSGSEPTDAVTIPVSNGLFSVKFGDNSFTNMTTLQSTVFDESYMSVRTWFSDDNVTFTALSPDQRIVSGGYAIKAQSAETAVSKTGDTMTGGLTVPSLDSTGDITATGSVEATGTGLTLSCIDRQFDNSLTAGATIDMRIRGGAGTDSSTTIYCGAGYEVFQTLCWGGNYPTEIRLSASGTYYGGGVCVFYNSGVSSRSVFLYSKCCKGSW